MNTNGLARHYHTLTTRERLPLMVAAFCRNDEAECDRLIQSAPRISYTVPDVCGLVEGVFAMTNFHVQKILHLACWYWQSMTGFLERANRNKDRHTKWLYLASYLLLVRTEGWQLVCQEYGIDSEAILTRLPVWDSVQQLNEMLELFESKGITREELAQQLRELPDDGEVLELPTPEDVQAEYRAAVEFHRSTWK